MISHYEKSVVSCSPDSLFAVILDIESYPKFVPGWHAAHIRSQEKDRLIVEQQLGIGPVYWTFTSSAFYRKPEQVIIRSHDGPFKKLEINWKLANAGENRCSVELHIHAEFSALVPQKLIKPLLKISARNVISLFEERVLSRVNGTFDPDSS